MIFCRHFFAFAASGFGVYHNGYELMKTNLNELWNMDAELLSRVFKTLLIYSSIGHRSCVIETNSKLFALNVNHILAQYR